MGEDLFVGCEDGLGDKLAKGLLKQQIRRFDDIFSESKIAAAEAAPLKGKKSRSAFYRRTVASEIRLLDDYLIAHKAIGEKKKQITYLTVLRPDDDRDMGIDLIGIPARDPDNCDLTQLPLLIDFHCAQRILQSIKTPSFGSIGRAIAEHTLQILDAPPPPGFTEWYTITKEGLTIWVPPQHAIYKPGILAVAKTYIAAKDLDGLNLRRYRRWERGLDYQARPTIRATRAGY
jgi:hypothetical protein